MWAICIYKANTHTYKYIVRCLSIEIYYIAVAYYLGSAVRRNKEEEQVVDVDEDEEEKWRHTKSSGSSLGAINSN